MRTSVSSALFVAIAALFATSTATPVEGVSKRYTNVPLEHWETDEVACPWTGVGHEPIPVDAVALPTALFDAGAHCRQQVSVTYQGTTYTGLILDECTDCADDGLGIIAQFWNKLAGDDSGDVIYGDWVFA